MREGVAIGEIEAALRRAELDSARLVGRAAGLVLGRSVGAGDDRATAERGCARVGWPALAARDDGVLGARVGNLDLGAQLVEAEPLDELGRLLGRRVDEELVRRRRGRPGNRTGSCPAGSAAPRSGRRPRASFSTSLVRSPCRKVAASGPATRVTPLSLRKTAVSVTFALPPRPALELSRKWRRARICFHVELRLRVRRAGPSSIRTGSPCATSASAAAGSPGSAISPPRPAESRVDCRGLHILPGVIDTPGAFPRAGARTQGGSRHRRARGRPGRRDGVFEMPNTIPQTTSAAALEDKIARASGRMACDFAFWVGGTHDNVDDIPGAGAAAGRGGDQGVHGLLHRLAAGGRRRGRAGDPQAHAPARRLPQRGRGAAHRAQGRSVSPAIPPRIPSGATRSRL